MALSVDAAEARLLSLALLLLLSLIGLKSLDRLEQFGDPLRLLELDISPDCRP